MSDRVIFPIYHTHFGQVIKLLYGTSFGNKFFIEHPSVIQFLTQALR
jgi:hypothetical protein